MSKAVQTIAEVERQIQGSMSAADRAVLTNVVEEQTEKCMQAKGWDFDYPAVTAEAFVEAPFVGGAGFWMLNSAELADQEGYGVQKLADAYETRVQQGLPINKRSLNEEELERFDLDMYGTEEEEVSTLAGGGSVSVAGGGCLAQARIAVYGDLVQWLQFEGLRERAGNSIFEVVVGDRDVQRALSRWRTCMRGEGWAFDDPDGALEEVFQRYEDGASVDQEIGIAADDIGCRSESGIANAFAASYLVHSAEVMSVYESDLEALATFELMALARAKELNAKP